MYFSSVQVLEGVSLVQSSSGSPQMLKSYCSEQFKKWAGSCCSVQSLSALLSKQSIASYFVFAVVNVLHSVCEVIKNSYNWETNEFSLQCN